MSQPDIKPEKINSPIQLMAAWFVMLILLSGVLLTAASQIENPNWAAGYLIISTSILIFAVILCVILMLTKFRPNLQDGKEYAEWLRDKNSYSPGIILEEKEDSSLKEIQDKINQIKAKSATQNNGEIVSKIEDSILYKVSVSNIDGASAVVSKMKKLGFEAKIYKSPIPTSKEKEDHEAIWLGSNISPSAAITVIKNAITLWPHLKYIHLSSDGNGPESTNWQVYLGGSTDTAKNRYKLKPWSLGEINNLKEKSISEFHADIRSKYP